MAVEGTLDLFQLPEILQLISQQQKTGILTVQGQNDIVAISFLSGKIDWDQNGDILRRGPLTSPLILLDSFCSRFLSPPSAAGVLTPSFLARPHNFVQLD